MPIRHPLKTKRLSRRRRTQLAPAHVEGSRALDAFNHPFAYAP